MYYFLSCFGPLDRDRASLTNIPQFDGIYWNMGDYITENIRQPISVDLYTAEGDAMVPMFNVGMLIMEETMIKALVDAGVDNLQLFDVVLHDRSENMQYDNYQAVNILGKIACADLDNSNYVAHGEPLYDVDFDGVEIDEAKANGAYMFRLAECVSGILIRGNVKEALIAAGIPYLDFVEPKDWIG